MTILKYILLTLLAIVVLLLIIAFFISPNFRVESKVIIDQPKPLVFDYLKHLKNQNNY